MSSLTVQIYDGAGAEPVCVEAMERELRYHLDTKSYQIERFNGRSIRPLSQRNVSAVVLPGGFSPRMGAELDLLAGQIEEVVNCDFGAGVYLSCAGAISTAKYHVTAETKAANRFSRLTLHEAETYFPYFLPDKSKGARESPLNLMNMEVIHGQMKGSFYHAFGPGFKVDPLKQREYKVLATYCPSGDWPEPLAATILRDRTSLYSVPAEAILATGIHPEISAEDLTREKAHFKSCPLHYEKLKTELEENEAIRHQVLRNYFQLIGLRLR